MSFLRNMLIGAEIATVAAGIGVPLSGCSETIPPAQIAKISNVKPETKVLEVKKELKEALIACTQSGPSSMTVKQGLDMVYTWCAEKAVQQCGNGSSFENSSHNFPTEIKFISHDAKTAMCLEEKDNECLTATTLRIYGRSCR